jgi:hypothetical protein
LTISGVYEERSEGHFMQKQFERTFDIPKNADVDSMASFITSTHMLVVEIPLNPSAHVDQLNIDNNANNQRRLSFSLNKYNTSNNQDSLSTSNDTSNLSSSSLGVRRTSMTKTTTTTTNSSGSSGIPQEALELLKNAETTIGNTSQTYTKNTTERHSSNTGNQLPIDIPSELLANGGSITIEKRRVSVTRETDGNTGHGATVPVTQSINNGSLTSKTTTNTTQSSNQTGVVPITRTNNTESTSSTNTTQSTHHTGVVPITRTNDTQSTSSNTLNQQQSNTSELRSSKVCLP